MIGSTVRGNRSSAGYGGGFHIGDESWLENSTISGNRANNFGGGIFHVANPVAAQTLRLVSTTVANNRAAAELMGIPSSRILALSFGIGTMLAAIAGGLIATFFSFTILSGDIYQQKSFVIGVLGGLGNPLGALVGGLILGVLEGLLPLAMPNTWVPVIEFLLFILILLIKPSGLLGGRQ